MHAALLVLLLDQAHCGALCSNEALAGYSRLLTRSWGPQMHVEHAAFLVRDGARVQLIEWTRQGTSTETSFHGLIPANCIGIVHTHPVMNVEPSMHDRAEARRIGLPILAVTQFALTVAWPDGTTSYLAESADWVRLARR